MEEFKIDDSFATEDEICKKYFDDTVARSNDGRFMVYRNCILKMVDSYNIGKHLFYLSGNEI